MEFDHKIYGFKIADLFKGDEEAEPHCSIILKLNNIEQIDEETFEITRGIPIEGNKELLKELIKSCQVVITKLKKFEADYKKKY